MNFSLFCFLFQEAAVRRFQKAEQRLVEEAKKAAAAGIQPMIKMLIHYILMAV